MTKIKEIEARISIEVFFDYDFQTKDRATLYKEIKNAVCRMNNSAKLSSVRFFRKKDN